MSRAPYCFLVCINMKGIEMVENKFKYLVNRFNLCPHCGDSVQMKPLKDDPEMWTLQCKDHLYIIARLGIPQKEAEESQTEGMVEE